VHSAEREFKSIIEQVAENFPKLKIVVEHISTKENAELLAS
jgi:dihydroorotase